MSPAPHKKPPLPRGGCLRSAQTGGEIQYLLPPIAEGDLPPYEEGGLFRCGGMRADEGIGPYNEIP